MMNTSLNEGSAKIYQFPAGGRAALGGRRYGEAKPATEFAASPVNKGSSPETGFPRLMQALSD